MENIRQKRIANTANVYGYKLVKTKTPLCEYVVIFTDGIILKNATGGKEMFFTTIEFDGNDFTHELRRVRVPSNCNKNNTLEIINSLKFGKFEPCNDYEIIRLEAFEKRIIERLDLKKRLKVLDYEIENYKPELPHKKINLF